MVVFYFLTTGKFKYELNKKLLFLKSVQRHSRLLQLATRNEVQFLFHVSSNTLVKDIKSMALGEFVHCMFMSLLQPGVLPRLYICIAQTDHNYKECCSKAALFLCEVHSFKFYIILFCTAGALNTVFLWRT